MPAYNEEKVIAETLRRLYDFLENNFSCFEIIVVDDGRVDSTATAVEHIAKQKNISGF